MRTIIGLLMVVAGVALGLYAGVWWAFIGGIVQIIEQIKAPELSAIAVAIGIAKVFFAVPIGWVCGAFLIVPGAAIGR